MPVRVRPSQGLDPQLIPIEAGSLRRLLPVSGTVTGSAVGAPQSADGGSPRRRALPITPVSAVITAATLLALGLRAYQLARPGELLGVAWYDDGVLFGSSLRLVHGVLPYRDFVFAQPPGITLLMVPAALLAKVTGTAWGMAVARILTLLASTASVVLGGLLVRHRGLLAAGMTCGLLAVYPASVTTTYTIFLEPWVALFCLAGALAVFDGDRLAGFLVPVLPFAALAPRRFYEGVFTAQLVRYHQVRVTVWTRLQDMAGLGDLHHVSHTTIAAAALVLAGFVAVTLVAASLVTRRPPPPLEWFGVLTAALVVAVFMWPPGFFFHFPAFLAPFLALALALPASRLLTASQPSTERIGIGPATRWIAAGLVAAVIGVFAVLQARSETSLTPRVAPAAIAADRRAIPPGACVLTDQSSFTIAADRFTSSVPGCSQMIDPLGTALTAYFHSNFVRVLHDSKGDTLYVRKGLHPR